MPQNYSLLSQLMSEIRGETKSASAIADPGGHAGPSTHPSKDVESGLHTLQTGSRFAENTEDVNKAEGAVTPEKVTAPKTTGDDQDKIQPNVGVEASATGEDPSVEDDYKGHKDDPGTTHPAEAGEGDKYAAFKKRSLADNANGLVELVDRFNAKIAASRAAGKSKTASAPVAAPVTQTTDPAVIKAAQAGYDAAASLGQTNQVLETLEKVAAEADHMAELTIRHLEQKIAEMQGPPGPQGMPAGEPDADDAGGPPDGDADDGAAPAGPSGPGGHVDPNALHELLSALMEMGITPDELAQMAQAEGPAPGAAPAGPVGPAPDGAPKLAMAIPQTERTQLIKLAGEAKKLQRSGKFAFGAPRDAKAAAMRTELRSYLAELVGAN